MLTKYFRMVTCDIFSGDKNVQVQTLSRNCVKSRQLDNTRANERTRLFHDTTPGKNFRIFFRFFSGKSLQQTIFVNCFLDIWKNSISFGLRNDERDFSV